MEFLKEILVPILLVLIGVAIPGIVSVRKASKEAEIRIIEEKAAESKQLHDMALELAEVYRKDWEEIRERVDKLEKAEKEMRKGIGILVKQIEDLGEEPKYRPNGGE